MHDDLKRRSGVAATVVDGRLRVLGVATDSPAQRAGLKSGDVVLTVDGADATMPVSRRWGAGPAGTEHLLSLADGRRVSIILEDYY